MKSVSLESYKIYAEEKKAEIVLAVDNRDNLTGIIVVEVSAEIDLSRLSLYTYAKRR